MEKVNATESTGQSKKIIRVLIAVFVLITIILVVVSIALLFTQESSDLNKNAIVKNSDQDINRTASRLRSMKRKPSEYRKFTFDDLFSGKVFLKDSYTTEWRKDGGLICKKDEFLGIDKSATVINPGSFEQVKFLDDSDFMGTMSSNDKYAYTTRTVKQIYRHSNEELYRIFRMFNGTTSGTAFAVGPKGDGLETILAFKWNPNPHMNDFVFVHEYNIYYQYDPEKPGTAVKITEGGDYSLRYGVADWLYEEEILSSAEAFWWSESGRYISYLRFDDRETNRVFIPKYVKERQYAQYVEIPYPKAGVEINPAITLYIWDRSSNKSVILFPPEELTISNKSYYVFANKWIPMPQQGTNLGVERLLTVWANREQNEIYITICSEVDCLLTFNQSFSINDRSMWAEPYDFKSIFSSKTGFFIILPHIYHDGNVYNHVAHIEIEPAGNGRITAWHGGSYDVRDIKGYDRNNDILTFISSGGGLGTQRLYKITRATGIQPSTDILSSYLPECEFGNFDVSPNGKRATLACITPFQNTKMYLMDIANPSNYKLLEGSDDAQIPFDLPDITYEAVQLESGYEVHIALMKPPKLNLSEKYPLLVDVYGGPNSYRVRRNTPSPNMIHFCSNYGIIVAWIDGRGSSNRGWNIKAPVYKLLGHFEAIDTIDSVKYLTSKYNYIDPKNVAVFGWSYGGFLATHIAVRDQGATFKCAIAVAPVADFMLYDSAYTERYLGMPLENPSGYNASQLINKASFLKNVKFMLAHGEADDNVHYQNSALLSEALQAEMIHYTQLVYGNQDHSMGNRQRHLFMEVGRFLSEECFHRR